MAPSLEKIDWQAPWLGPYRAVGQTVAERIAAGLPCHEALNRSPHALMRFVAQQELPTGQAYEDFIFQTGRCPTRDGLHDFFNGLCWLHYPRTKKKLNALQAHEIADAGIGPLRGPVRDGLTVFDENAAFLQAPDALWSALLAKDWAGLFGDFRPLWQQANLHLFGHALLEKLVRPRKAITAHLIRVPLGLATITELDHWVAQNLSADQLASKPFAPLPVLGVPGWWAPNQDPAFYADREVFRLPHNGRRC